MIKKMASLFISGKFTFHALQLQHDEIITYIKKEGKLVGKRIPCIPSFTLPIAYTAGKDIYMVSVYPLYQGVS